MPVSSASTFLVSTPRRGWRWRKYLFMQLLHIRTAGIVDTGLAVVAMGRRGGSEDADQALWQKRHLSISNHHDLSRTLLDPGFEQSSSCKSLFDN